MKRFLAIILSGIMMFSMTNSTYAETGYLKMEPVKTYGGFYPSSYQDKNGYNHYAWGSIDLSAIEFADYVADYSNRSVKVAVIDSGAEVEHHSSAAG